MPRYERIISLIGVVMTGLGMILLVEKIHILTMTLSLPGGLEAQVSIAWLILLFLLVVMAVGTESVQPEESDLITGKTRRLHPVSWILPVLLTLTAFLFLRLLQGFWERVVGLIVVALLLLVALIAQHHSRDGRPRVRDMACTSLDLLAQVDAFFLYGAIYTLKVRSLFSATSIVVLTFLLAYTSLRRLASGQQSGLIALVIGLCVGQVTWSLNYWAIRGMFGGAFLLVVFYVLVGIARQHLQGRLSRRVVLEYILVGLVLSVPLVVVEIGPLLFP